MLTVIALRPFHRNAAGEFWTSASVRDHTVFGYTYPELIGLSDNVTLVQRVNALYGPNATSQFSWGLDQTSPMAPSFPNSSSTVAMNCLESPLGTTAADVLPKRDFQYQYYANVRIKKNRLGSAFRVYVFLGAESEIVAACPDTLEWVSDPGFVGYVGFQSTGGKDGTVAPGMGEGVTGVVALTKVLEDRTKTRHLPSLDKITVEAYLQAHMTWKIAVVCLHPLFHHLHLILALYDLTVRRPAT